MSEGASNFNNQFRQKNAQFRHPCFQPQVLLYNLRKVIGMLYQVQRQSGTRRFYTEVRSCIKIPYTTVREMKLRYPDESFIIIGEIGGLSCASKDADMLCVGDGKVLPILPWGSLIRPFEWVIGYIEVQKDHYVAVIGGIIHLFISLWHIIKRSTGN